MSNNIYNITRNSIYKSSPYSKMQQFHIAQQHNKQKQTQQSLLDTLLSFQNQMITLPNNRMQQIHDKFMNTQKQVLEVVQYRKGLQAVLKEQQMRKQQTQKMIFFYDKFQMYEKEIQNLSLKVREKQGSILTLKKQIHSKDCDKKYQESRQKQIKAINKLQDKVKDLTTSLLHFADSSQPTFLNNNIAQYRQNITKYDKQNNSLNTIQVLKNRSQMLKLKEQILQQTFRSQDKYVSSLKQSVKMYEQILCAKNSSKEKQTSIFGKYKDTKSNKQKLNSSRCQKLDISYEHLAKSYENQIFELKNTIQELLKQKEQLENRHITKVQKLQKQINDLSKSIELQKAQEKSVVKQKETLNKEHKKQLLEMQKKFNRQIQQQNQTVSKLSKQNIDLIQKISIKDQELKEKQIKLTDLINNVSCKEQEIQIIKSQLKITENQVTNLNIQNKTLLESLGTVKNSIQIDTKRYLQACNQASSMQNKYKLKINQLTKEYFKISKELQEQKKMYQQMQTRLQSEIELIDTLNEQIVHQRVINRQLRYERQQLQECIISQQQLNLIKQQIEEQIRQQWVQKNEELDHILGKLQAGFAKCMVNQEKINLNYQDTQKVEQLEQFV